MSKLIRGLVEDLLSLKLLVLYGIYLLFALILMFLYNHEVWSDELYLSGFDGTAEAAAKKMESIRRIDNFRYALLPVQVALKVFVIYILIYLGELFLSLKVDNVHVLKSIIIAEFTFLLEKAVSVIWFVFFNNAATRKEIDYFSPLGVISFIDDQVFIKQFSYPLKILSLFEVLFVCILTYCLSLAGKYRFGAMLKLVLLSYGVAVFIYLLLLFLIAA